MTTETTAGATELLIDRFEDMTRDQMINHLGGEYHGAYLSHCGLDSKSRKVDLVVAHKAMHDFPLSEEEERSHTLRRIYAVTARNAEGDRYFKKNPHRHGVPTEAESGDVGINGVDLSNLKKPLTASEKRAMKELVDNDFAALRKDMEMMAEDILKARLSDLEAEYADKANGLQRVVDKGEKFKSDFYRAKHEFDSKWTDKENAFKSEALEKGYEVSRLTSNNPVLVELVGKSDRIKEVKEQTQRETASAKLSMERQRLGAQRAIMLAGVPKESLALIQAVPTATDLMREAAKGRPRPEITT